MTSSGFKQPRGLEIIKESEGQHDDEAEEATSDEEESGAQIGEKVKR